MTNPDIFTELRDCTVRARLSGTGPRTLVLLHELGGSLESFDTLLPLLPAGWRVLCYDQRGSGLSEKPRAPFSLNDHAADLEGLLAALGLKPPYHLAGIAAGAAIAVAFALACPNDVAALALCCPALTVPPERHSYLADRSALAAREGMRAIVDATLGRSFPERLRGDGHVYRTYRARFLANDPVTYGFANMALAGAQLQSRLDTISPPCLVLAGQHDLLRPPADVTMLATRIPGARYDVIESGHLMSVQAPAAMAQALTRFFTMEDADR